ncbi:MAG: imidazole glycerol phosphate synthase subunit HisH [Anaerolineales bacterium]
MICIVDYKAGNITSVQRALNHLGVDSEITPDPEVLLRAEKVIFPGVGQAGSAMDALRSRGLDQALRKAFARSTPILGICLGAQIVMTHSEENDTACLDLIPGECRRFEPTDPALKIPHMGWDAIRIRRQHPFLKGLRPDQEFYFVHSYYPQPADGGCVAAECEYGGMFPAVIGRANLVAAQFHPEKSGPAGLNLLKNFLAWDGSGGFGTC